MHYLVNALGGRAVIASEPVSAGEWVERIESGLPVAAALAFKESLKLTLAELAALLGVSTRTVARWDSAKSRLDPVSGDRLVRSARLFAIATEVLEDSQAAARWLRRPQRALGNRIPLDLARTDVGGREVEDLLGRMEYGVYT